MPLVRTILHSVPQSRRRARHVVPILVVAVLVAACQERITAPGACPAFCPSEDIVAVDTVLTGIITGDTTFRGYRQPYAADAQQLITLGEQNQSVGVLRFPPFPLRLTGEGDTILRQDSFGLRVTILRRSLAATGLELAVHRLPDWVDSSTTQTELIPWFDDSTVVGIGAIPDSQEGGIFAVVMDSLAFEDKVLDRTVPVVGISLRALQETFLELGVLESGDEARLNRFVESDSLISRVDALVAAFDGFVPVDPPPIGVGVLAVGGAPSARTILRFDFPSVIIDSGDISRATLILVPTEPVVGVAADTVQLRATPVFHDVGRKSPPIDLLAAGADDALLGVGATDTLFVEITSILRQWRAQTSLPRTIILSTTPEGGSILEARFSSSQGPAPPALHVTYVPPKRRDP